MSETKVGAAAAIARFPAHEPLALTCVYIYLYVYIHAHVRIYIYIYIYMYVHTPAERWGAGVETQKNVRGVFGGWGRVPFNEPYAPSLSTIYDGA